MCTAMRWGVKGFFDGMPQVYQGNALTTVRTVAEMLSVIDSAYDAAVLSSMASIEQ